MKQAIRLLIFAAMLLAAPATKAMAPPAQGEDYIVQADDWLSKLAEKFLADVLAYPAITHYTNQKNVANASYARILDSDFIEIGDKIYIPSPTEAASYLQEAEGQRFGDGEITLGALMPLSAPGAVSGGRAMRVAFEIGLAEINDQGGLLGQPVELVMIDTEGLPERGREAMRHLIVVEQVVGVVGEYHSPVGLAVKEVAAANNLPVIFAETWADAITADQQPQIFRIGPVASEVAAMDAGFIQSIGAGQVVIIAEAAGFGVSAAALTAERLAEVDIASTVIPVDFDTVDFGPVIAQLQAGPAPDVIVVMLTGQNSFAFQQQAAEAGLGPQAVTMICNQTAADSEAFWAAVPDGNLCIWRRIGLPQALWTPETTAFAAAYAAKTGQTVPEPFAMEAYDSLMLMAAAIRSANATEPEAIIAALEAIRHEGALGTITFPFGRSNPLPPDREAKWWHQFPDPAVTLVQYAEPGQAAADATVVYPPTYRTGALIQP